MWSGDLLLVSPCPQGILDYLCLEKLTSQEMSEGSARLG